MTLDEFLEKLYEAGWRPTCDAQYEGISGLYRALWPHTVDDDQIGDHPTVPGAKGGDDD